MKFVDSFSHFIYSLHVMWCDNIFHIFSTIFSLFIQFMSKFLFLLKIIIIIPFTISYFPLSLMLFSYAILSTLVCTVFAFFPFLFVSLFRSKEASKQARKNNNNCVKYESKCHIQWQCKNHISHYQHRCIVAAHRMEKYTVHRYRAKRKQFISLDLHMMLRERERVCVWVVSFYVWLRSTCCRSL